MGTETDKQRFRNRLCLLRSIDRDEVIPGLTETQWMRFRDDPYRSYLEFDEASEATVWRALRDREDGPGADVNVARIAIPPGTADAISVALLDVAEHGTGTVRFRKSDIVGLVAEHVPVGDIVDMEDGNES